MRHFLGFPETLHFWPLGTEKYPGILVMNFSLGFIQLKVVPLNFPSEKCHVIHHPCYSSSHPRWLLGFPFTHRTLNWLPSNAVRSMSSSSMVLPFPHHHLPHQGSSQLLPPPWSPCFRCRLCNSGSPGAGGTMSLKHSWSCSSPTSESFVPNLTGSNNSKYRHENYEGRDENTTIKK